MDAGTRWKAGVIASLAGVVGLYVVLIRVAADPAALAHDERYYQHAINHDAEQAMQQRAERLGWQVQVSSTPPASPAPQGFTARVLDRAGSPVTGATVRFTAYHLAHANDVSALHASPSADGYTATLAGMRPGLWDVEVEVYRGTDHLRVTQRVDVPRATVASR
jgi:nitrogen fixation protein FixH